MKMNSYHYILFLFLIFSCSPTKVLIKHDKILSFYFENKISMVDKKKNKTKIDKNSLLKLNVEYGFGVLMEKSDRIIFEDYSEGLKSYKKAKKYFGHARIIGIELLSEKYSSFDKWLLGDVEIEFEQKDIENLYWLMAAYSGSISSSRGDPFELINIPVVEKLLRTCIKLDSDWNNGALYSALMSYTSIRTDLNEENKIDTITFYFNKALTYSDSLDASLYVNYSELVHKPNLEKELFLEKLNIAKRIKVVKKNRYYLTNLIAQNRARWLISNIDEYFLD